MPVAVGEVLVFEHGGKMYSVDATAVEEVIAWREPVPLPRATSAWAGVLQSRGRIVSVLRNPRGMDGDAEAGGQAPPARIVVCRTHVGWLGLPATTIVSVDAPRAESTEEEVEVEPSVEAEHLDPAALVRALGREEDAS